MRIIGQVLSLMLRKVLVPSFKNPHVFMSRGERLFKDTAGVHASGSVLGGDSIHGDLSIDFHGVREQTEFFISEVLVFGREETA